MFNCGRCGRTTDLGEKGSLIVTEKRDKEYQPKDRHGNLITDRNGASITTKGWEIVKEIRVCEKCA